MTKGIKRFSMICAALTFCLVMISFIKIKTDYYCCESPTIRWKFAIYCGECDDETGCHYTLVKNTGVLEYFGLKPIPCDIN